MNFKIALAAAGAALMVAASPASAAITYFNTATSGTNQGGGVQSGTTGSGTVGNIRTYTDGSITITATALSLVSGSLQSANLGYHAGNGLGVCNAGGSAGEGGSGCGSPGHQVDNNTGTNNPGKDFVLLQFNAAVTIDEILVKTFSSADTDVTYYLGNIANNASLVNATLAGLTGMGFVAGVTDDGASGSNATNTVAIGGGKYNAILVGTPSDQYGDAWKMQSISYTASTTPGPPGVPEPMSLALLATGLIGLGAASRRRRAA